MLKIQRKTVPFAWVKNVYSLRTASGNNSAQTALSYTAPQVQPYSQRVQLPTYTQVTRRLSAALSTLTMSLQPLLITHLYPVSTVPTIKKNKENKERNS
jgi:hypothetical protein